MNAQIDETLAIVIYAVLFVAILMGFLLRALGIKKDKVRLCLSRIKCFIHKYAEYIIAITGTMLFSLRIVFPVLVKSNRWMIGQSILFFSLDSKGGYVIHTFRTYSQAFVILVITGVLWGVVYSLKRSNEKLQ
jgi:hypothetical protein